MKNGSISCRGFGQRLQIDTSGHADLIDDGGG